MNSRPRQLSPFWILFILTGLNLFNYLDRYVLSAVLQPLMKDLSLTDSQGGTLGTAFMLGYFVTSPFFGILGDRVSRKWLIALGILIWTVGTILSGFATSFAMLVAFRVLVGVGEASYATIGPGVISDCYEGPKRNTALTIFYVAIPVGAALGNLIGGQIAEHSSWRNAFIWAGAPGLLLALVMLPFAEPPRAPATAESKPGWKDALGLFLIPDYLLVVAGYTAYTFALGGFQHWGSTFLQRVHQVPIGKAGQFFGISMVVSGLVGTFLGGFISSAWRKRNAGGYAWLIGGSVALAVPVVTAAFLAGTPGGCMTLLAASMFLLFLSMGPVNTLIIESAPAHLRASAMAMSIFAIHMFGDLWSPKIIGAMADSASLSRAMLILPVALVVAAILWLALGMRLVRRAAA